MSDGKKVFDIYVRYSVKANTPDEVYDAWDDGKAVFQEFTDIIEVL